MHKLFHVALLFIATSALSPCLAGQKVYKCGTTYSQIPCPDGAELEASDPRTKEQQSETEKAALRAAKAATVLEKTRIKEEKNALDAQKPAKVAGAASQSKETKAKSKNQESEFFTATSPPEKEKQP